MITNRYNYLIHRVEYPAERGYRMERKPLPDWIYVTVTTDDDNDTKYLTVHSRFHMNKEVRINSDYSTSFSDNEIIKDLSGDIAHRFSIGKG